MDVANLLSHDPPRSSRSQENAPQETQRLHQYPTRHSVMSNNMSFDGHRFATPPVSQSYGNSTPTGYSISPTSHAPKNVAFELLFDGATNHRARLPMRVQIFPHDTTDSIVTTVKNFYGLYEGAANGVSFEDDRGNTLIARYENFQNNMVVYVRVIPDYSQAWQQQGHVQSHSASPVNAQKLLHLDEGFQMPPPQPSQILIYGQSMSRPASRVSRKQSASPRPGRGRRSISAQKARSRSSMMSREDSFQGQLNDLNSDVMKGYSSSDGEGGSVTSSRKARSEQLASADISLNNILEGNRRKRAKFESSELPLFVPPQVPASNSISSISPQRRSNGQDNPSPFARPTQQRFTYSQPLQSSQSYGYGEHTYGIVPQSRYPSNAPPAPQTGRRLRDRANAPSLSARMSNGLMPRAQGFGILPTPDPTIASCISDEDVALQLMRLGDASNISHGRTSASTLDDAFSGRADAASSATSNSDDDGEDVEQPSLPVPPAQPKLEASPELRPNTIRRHHKHLNDGLPSTDSTEPSGDEVDGDYVCEDRKDGIFKSEPDDVITDFGQALKPRLPGSRHRNMSKASSSSSLRNTSKVSKSKTTANAKKAKPSLPPSSTKVPPSPASLPPPSRKTSSASTVNFQHQGDEDLSSKPRCQRCRKSKKGCDRQRPCQRCKDAGIGAEGCISEDEGNGRKGRFGRHMGVAVKKDAQEVPAANETEEAGAILDGMAGAQEKSKKRKR
ncbi:MAG: hypothetical protein ASARMPRED_008350 [Alectoria sarmentosa]|nr:MAG: hypothetical protein ASARMPRED_008350 [Alectoria sarmentosa]